MTHIQCNFRKWLFELSAQFGIVIVVGLALFIFGPKTFLKCGGIDIDCFVIEFFDFLMLLLFAAIGALIGIDAYQHEEKKRRAAMQGKQSYEFKVSGPDWEFEASGTDGKWSDANPEPAQRTGGDEGTAPPPSKQSVEKQ